MLLFACNTIIKDAKKEQERKSVPNIRLAAESDLDQSKTDLKSQPI